MYHHIVRTGEDLDPRTQMTLISSLLESERGGERKREWKEESRLKESGRGWEKVEQAKWLSE